MSLLDEAREAPEVSVFFADGSRRGRFLDADARDALVELADAAQLVAERPFAKDALADFHAALERLIEVRR